MRVGQETTVFIHEYVSGGGMAGMPLPRSWLAEGRAMRDALVRDFAALPEARVVYTCDPRVPPVADGDVQVLIVDPGREEAVVRESAPSADFSLVVAPETGGMLAQRVKWLSESGGRSLGAGETAIACAADKWRTYQALLGALNLRQPQTWLGVDISSHKLPLGSPYVVKPIDGAGCLETRRIDDARRLLVEDCSGFLVQEFVRGRPRSASFLVEGARVVPVGIAEQRIKLEEGRFSYLGGSILSDCLDRCELVAEVFRHLPPMRGWVGVDFIETDNGPPAIVDINPRPTTSLVGFQRVFGAGAIASAWIRLVEGANVPDAQHFRARAPLAPASGFRADGSDYTNDA